MSILVLVGAFGVGKSTAGDALCEKYGAHYLKSYTSRSTRSDEPDNGAMIYDVPRQELQLMNERGEMEWVDEYVGHLYGTKKQDIKTACESRECYIMILVPTVLLRLDNVVREYCGRVEYIFFDPISDTELGRRMDERGLPREEIEARLKKINWYKEESEKTGLEFTHIKNDGTPEELIREIADSTRRGFGDEVLLYHEPLNRLLD